jgi:hypothetical protein
MAASASPRAIATAPAASSDAARRAGPGNVAAIEASSALFASAPARSPTARPISTATATAAARTSVAANVADLGRLTEDRTGRLGFVVGARAAVAA